MSAITLFREAVLIEALSDFRSGVRETSKNDGPEIREYLKAFGLKPPKNWCASAVAAWLRRAADKYGVVMPIAGSAGARATMGQLMRAGLWIPWQDIDDSVILPGNILVWWRVAPEDWRGHIGVVERLPDPEEVIHIHGKVVTAGHRVLTIEGNSGPRGDRVDRMLRDLADPKLLGIGLLEKELAVKPSEAQLERAAELIKLGDEVMLGEPTDPLADFWERTREPQE